MSDSWTMEEAKNDFGAIAEAAYSGRPQHIKDDTHPDLILFAQTPPTTNSNQDRDDNKNFIDFLLSAPRGDWEFETDDKALKMRDIDQ